jgi:MFS family permease
MSDDKPKNPLREIVQPFIDLIRAPRALWGVNLGYFLEGFVYFGMLGYLAMYFNDFVGLTDVQASPMVGFLTVGITVAMVVLGGRADKLGTRKALILALLLMLIGRVIVASGSYLGLSPGMWGPLHLVTMGALLFVIVGYGLWQPGAYAAVRVFTSPKTAAMGFAMLYALMNLGGWLPSFFSPVRQAIGINGAYWVYSSLTALALVLTFLILSRKVVAKAIADAKAEREQEEGTEKKKAEEESGKPKEPFSLLRWLKQHPLADPRFAFFIFCLIPVQTLFAHNWLTLPQYTERAFSPPEKLEVCEDANPSAEADAAFERAQDAEVDALKLVVTSFEGTQGACHARQHLRELAKSEPDEGEHDKAAANRREEAKRAIRNFDYLAAAEAAAAKGDVSERLRLWIGANFEAAVNFNPLLIFILVPIVAAITRKKNVYNMMIIGTFVMAAPTFLLALGANFWTLLGYLIFMTLGEAMWQPRFLQYAAEIAPEGRTGSYIGVAQIPWFLTKAIVPAYSGWFLQNYCPKEGETSTEFMWLIYGCIAIVSTLLLLAAKRWITKDFKTKA